MSDPAPSTVIEDATYPYAEDIDGVWHKRRDGFWDCDIFADIRAHTVCGKGIWSCHVSEFEPDDNRCGRCFSEPVDAA